MATKTAARLRPVKVKAALPLSARWRVRWPIRGELVCTDVVWTSRRRWDRSSLAATGDWTLLGLGPFVIALRNQS
jgi:hypothetical protein